MVTNEYRGLSASPSLTIHVSRRAGDNESTARGRYLNRGCAAYNKTRRGKKGRENDRRDEGRGAVARIIAREQGIVKVAGWRHDWPVSPISVEGIDERTTMRRQGAFVPPPKYCSRRIFRDSPFADSQGDSLPDSWNEEKQLWGTPFLFSLTFSKFEDRNYPSKL